MVIGYDGKRAYQNKTGLGNYIRSLLPVLAEYYPDEKYVLFAPEQTGLFDTSLIPQADAVFPDKEFYKKLPALWRRYGMVKAIKDYGVDIYHGVSNELPNGIQRSGARSVVTVHDIIFERFPETYNFDERYVHRWKIKYACRVADVVVAISEQTKNDLIEFYKVPAEKITVVYQSCNPIFQRIVSENEKQEVKKLYNLPDKYFLFVSSIAPRKNLIAICKAMVKLKGPLQIPLVVIGNGKKEKQEAKDLMAANNLEHLLILLNEMPQSKEPRFTTAADFPAIYQQGLALIYPSIFEGFGAPLLEALWSGLPVISSNASCLPEVGGDAALYFEPHDIDTLAQHLLNVANNGQLTSAMIAKGKLQAGKFSKENYAKNMMAVYNKIVTK
ncbi:MAG: glycosyltransferase family 1 protein [Bacteroidota bacterium]